MNYYVYSDPVIPEIPESVSTIEAAKLLKVSVQTVQKWVDAGHLDAWKTVGGHRRISASSLRRFLESRFGTGADTTATSTGRNGRKRVLVVDDDPQQLDMLEIFLTSKLPDIGIETARDGFKALVSVGRQRPDVLISDLQLTGLDGLKMLATLRADPLLENVHIFVVTGLSSSELGALEELPPNVSVFHKPVDRQALAIALQNLFAHRA